MDASFFVLCSFFCFLLTLFFFSSALFYGVCFLPLYKRHLLNFAAPMDCLYTDGEGVVPTSGRECMVAGKWIALNASAGKIPSTEIFQQALEDCTFLSPDAAARPSGCMWTKCPRWYADHFHWDAWTTVDC